VRLLDLFCGAGGCSVGYHRAGFDVVGVDLHPQPNFPFPFKQCDVLTLAGHPWLRAFDAIHASPPCQAYTALVARRLGRHAVGVELNLEYLAIAATRLQQLSLLA
jgi:DNA (cytosine-5)-methyltransferase 1